MPNENFFAFKMFKNLEKDKNAKEMSEIKRLNEMAINHGSYIHSNPHQAYLLPVI